MIMDMIQKNINTSEISAKVLEPIAKLIQEFN